LEARVQERTGDLLRVNAELREREKALSESEARVQRELAQQKRTEEALRAREAQLRLVTDHAPVFITQLDREHRFKFVNRTYARRFDLEPEQLTGKHFTEVMVGRASVHQRVTACRNRVNCASAEKLLLAAPRSNLPAALVGCYRLRRISGLEWHYQVDRGVPSRSLCHCRIPALRGE